MQHAATRSRAYAGKSADQRRAERRAALLKAAQELWREQGWAAVTMRGVCARAKLTDRYFYESFSDRDAILGEVWDATRDDHLLMLAPVMAALNSGNALGQLHSAVETVVRRIADDPGGAQILFGDHAGSATLERRRRETIQTVVELFMDLARPYLLPDVSEAALRVSVLVGIGGFVETILAWRSGTLSASAEDLVASLDQVSRSLARDLLDVDI